MLQNLWIATKNSSKISEFQELLSKRFLIKSLNDLFALKHIDINETGKSFIENAILKAKFLSEKIQGLVIADDSGLEIKALNNFPGIYSARWMGEMEWPIINKKILEKMQNINDRSCQYVCALALVDVTKNLQKVFIGYCKGLINYSIQGKNGFGYDPIFFIPEYKKTFAQLSSKEKNKISHRSQALQQLLKFIDKDNNNE